MTTLPEDKVYLQHILESTKISEENKLKMAGIEWQRIKGFRNILVHDYLGDVDYKIIRAVIEIELPKLKLASQKMLMELGIKE